MYSSSNSMKKFFFYFYSSAVKVRVVFLFLFLLIPMGSSMADVITDPSLMMHYVFEKNEGDKVKDLSKHGNHGIINGAKWLSGKSASETGLRFDEKSWINCGTGDKVRIHGDMTMEMRIRLNTPVNQQKIGHIFMGMKGFQLSQSQYSTVAFYYTNVNDAREMMVEPVDNSILSDEWGHVAIVVAYPRIRFYRDGKLLRDAYMPFPGIDGKAQGLKSIGNRSGGTLGMDIKEFRLYRRALSPLEIQAHAENKPIAPLVSRELTVEPNWYQNHIIVRLSTQDENRARKTVGIALEDSSGKIVASQENLQLVDISENGSGRYAVTARFPLSPQLRGKKLTAVSQFTAERIQVKKEFILKKPDWIHTRSGYSDTVPAPWTPVTTKVSAEKVRVGIWGREYDFGATPLLQQITTKQQTLLTAPATLDGRINGQDIKWQGKTLLQSASPDAATVEQLFHTQNGDATLKITAKTEYDGYTIYTCNLTANREVNVEHFKLNLPIKSEFAKLCYGDRMLPQVGNDIFQSFYSGEVKSDLSFKFSPNVWIGNDELGLNWQTESDQYWRNADPQKAIQILQQGKSTAFRFNFVDKSTKLAAGQALHYQFALLATPIKPLKKDAWSWRIAVNEPQGDDLMMPDRTFNGKPLLEYYREIGIRNLFTNASDIWPWPMPKHEKYSHALHRMVKAAHEAGVRVHPYLIHQRFPVMVPEFETYGLDMASRPVKTYVQSTRPLGSARPGPLALAFGSNSQGCIFMCAKSMALQDAYIYSLEQRLKTYGDNGVYLDGTVHPGPLCENREHGDGYIDEQGIVRGTYPMFAIREFMKRIYVVVKGQDPDNIVNVHCSWGWNPAGLAYADVQWNGEQFGPMFKHKGVPDGYIPSALSLERFRTEFTGYQLGVAGEMLTYRLGKPYHCAAISLLHDISPRLYTNNFDNLNVTSDVYYAQVPKIWKMRDEFGAEKAKKYFYWDNQEYVSVSEAEGYATLLHNPKTGVLCIVSNLSRESKNITLRFNLDKLGLQSGKTRAFDPLTGSQIKLENGMVNIPLDSQGWRYIWLKNN